MRLIDQLPVEVLSAIYAHAAQEAPRDGTCVTHRKQVVILAG